MAAEQDSNRALPDLILDIDSAEDDHVTFPNTDSPTLSSKSNTKNNQDTQSSTSQPTGKPLNNNNNNNNNNKHQLGDEQKLAKVESKATPRRAQFGASKQKASEAQSTSRPCEQHTFLTDITEVRQMEQGLLKLLDDFHLGKLQAFVGKDCTFEKMEQVREQQERLARLHFELNTQQEMYGPQSEDGRRIGRENLGKLIENLQQLSRSIEQLQISSPSLQTDV
ncbi:coiled-coil domain-containing protein 28A-like [Argiope bruennichi]|uniref:Coiled-coil domain-containing protein 28B n=1 Tax=Argiope bruennichi TaxID=94029 RepID=A0A8T0F2Q9_ARGBR|nr:coiled-coil domain-containing protein 28A-like [Argiope bruennichi]KAF8784568.1 Coiled-coil domain-containing protein 28B [Argiope bruennichi]